jgi:hypothetical protein
LFADAPDADPSIRAIELGLQFNREQIGWSHQYSDRLDHNMQVSFGWVNQEFSLGPGAPTFSLDVKDVYARAEWRYRLTNKAQFTFGTDNFFDYVDVSYFGPPPGQDEGSGDFNSLSPRPDVSIHDQRWRYQPGIYTELDIRVIPKLRLVPGMRIDYFDDIQHFAFDPRIAGIYSFNDQWRVKAGVGVFSQAPQPQESSPTIIGNPNLVPIKALHTSAGVDHNFTEDLSLGVEGFYKKIYDRVVAPDGAEDPRPYVNDGIGRIYGLEVSGRKNASGRWFGFLSYTLMRSERKDRDDPWRLFDFDQTHILTVAGTVRLGRGWELGGTFRVVTGNPRRASSAAPATSTGAMPRRSRPHQRPARAHLQPPRRARREADGSSTAGSSPPTSTSRTCTTPRIPRARPTTSTTRRRRRSAACPSSRSWAYGGSYESARHRLRARAARGDDRLQSRLHRGLGGDPAARHGGPHRDRGRHQPARLPEARREVLDPLLRGDARRVEDAAGRALRRQARAVLRHPPRGRHAGLRRGAGRARKYHLRG